MRVPRLVYPDARPANGGAHQSQAVGAGACRVSGTHRCPGDAAVDERGVRGARRGKRAGGGVTHFRLLQIQALSVTRSVTLLSTAVLVELVLIQFKMYAYIYI